MSEIEFVICLILFGVAMVFAAIPRDTRRG
jgi:hypothetical protein